MDDQNSDGMRRVVNVGVRVLPGDRDNELLVDVVNHLHHVDVLLLVHEEVLTFFMFLFLPLVLASLPIP